MHHTDGSSSRSPTAADENDEKSLLDFGLVTMAVATVLRVNDRPAIA